MTEDTTPEAPRPVFPAFGRSRAKPDETHQGEGLVGRDQDGNPVHYRYSPVMNARRAGKTLWARTMRERMLRRWAPGRAIVDEAARLGPALDRLADAVGSEPRYYLGFHKPAAPAAWAYRDTDVT